MLRYFAYGSNMLCGRLRQRVPSAQPLGAARLDGHVLRWHKRGRDGSGKCDVEPAIHSMPTVHGVLYAMSPSDKPALDQAEGLGAGYDERRVRVLLGGIPVDCFLYRATLIDPGVLPFTWYKALVIAGASEHGLPPDYIAELTRVPATPDADVTRHASNMALASLGPVTWAAGSD